MLSCAAHKEAFSVQGKGGCPVQAQAYVDDEYSLQLLLRWTSAFSRSLMWHVREECDLEAEMKVRYLTSVLQ